MSPGQSPEVASPTATLPDAVESSTLLRLETRVQSLEELRIQVAELKLLPALVDGVSQKLTSLESQPASPDTSQGRPSLMDELKVQDELWQKLIALEELKRKVEGSEASPARCRFLEALSPRTLC